MNRKSLILVALIAIVAGLASCNKQITFTEDDLHGRWQEEDKNAYVFYLFMEDTVSDLKDKGYHWAYEWDEGDGVYEADVLAEQYGNGWFLYSLEGDQLTQYHQMSNGGAHIPKTYTVTVLTNTDFKYQDAEKVAYSYKKLQQ